MAGKSASKPTPFISATDDDFKIGRVWLKAYPIDSENDTTDPSRNLPLSVVPSLLSRADHKVRGI